MHSFKKETYIKLIFFICLISISSAYFIEYILGYQPCNLCLIERIPYGLGAILIFLNYMTADELKQISLDGTLLKALKEI